MSGPLDGAPPRRDASVRGTGRERYRATRDAEARLLLLIDAFSRKRGGQVRYLEGRVKLAKLDFLLRYPRHLARVLASRDVSPQELSEIDIDEAPLDARMMRYRYGPWDPAYFAVLGSLIGRGLVEVAPLSGSSGFGYRTTEVGFQVAAGLRQDESFVGILARLKLITRHLDKSGNTLKNLVYELPEVADATWGEEVA